VRDLLRSAPCGLPALTKHTLKTGLEMQLKIVPVRIPGSSLGASVMSKAIELIVARRRFSSSDRHWDIAPHSYGAKCHAIVHFQES
jgi:hypothetical protein